jgi:glyoxylase-like metal-dependent hydrolase (beta-lactamase superfamily II)
VCPVQILENVFVVPEVRANAYVIVDADGLTLIDTGLPRSQGRILRFLSDLGKAPGDLKRILITHADWDHIGGLAALHQRTGARTYASKIEAEAMAAGRSSRATRMPASTPLLRRLMRAFMKPRPFQVDEILTDGQVLPQVLGGLHVIDTAGHCPGHISFFSPSTGILFCGDSMVTDEQGIHGSRPVFTWDETLAREAVRKQAALGAHILCSGHGPVIRDAAGKFPV